MIVFIIFIAILSLFGLLLFVPLSLGLEYNRKDKNQDIHLLLYIFRIPFRIPIKTKDKEKRKDTDKEKQPAGRANYDDFKRNVSHFIESYHETKEQISDSIRYIRAHTTCPRFLFTVHFGLSDAAKTGIMTGATWTTGTLLLRVIDQMIGIKKVEMNVYPDFNKQCFDVHIKCILRVQTVHIINVGLKILKIMNTFTSKEISA